MFSATFLVVCILWSLFPSQITPTITMRSVCATKDQSSDTFRKNAPTNYRDFIGRISAGGYIARVDAKVYKNPANDFFDVSLYLSSNEKHLPDDAGIPDEANWAELPRAFHRVPADPTSAFTDEDREREKARRAQMNAEYEAQREMDSETKLGRAIKAFKAPDDQSQEVAKSDMRNGCATILAVVVVIVVLILIF